MALSGHERCKELLEGWASGNARVWPLRKEHNCAFSSAFSVSLRVHTRRPARRPAPWQPPRPAGPEPAARLVLLDHGLTLGLEPSFVATLGRLVCALEMGDLEGPTVSLGEVALPINEDTDLDTLLRLVGVLRGGERQGSGTGFGRKLGASVGDIPPRLLLVGRAIGLLDGITRQLDPDLDGLEIVRRHTRASQALLYRRGRFP